MKNEVLLGPVNDHGIFCHQNEPHLALMTCWYFQCREHAITKAEKIMYGTDTL